MPLNKSDVPPSHRLPGWLIIILFASLVLFGAVFYLVDALMTDLHNYRQLREYRDRRRDDARLAEMRGTDFGRV
ncbi:hypothetical protein CC80DRAFT_594884 [Byssothecium circinans]|uniref:Uncharacterized protein n=1 Tax=Byssothecium circinans TaxID=147558 RepID=A0A6A5TT72_9PLEO|nr:hypothetical protein CC80DRAFT_594884 [Byssothecium circinans]